MRVFRARQEGRKEEGRKGKTETAQRGRRRTDGPFVSRQPAAQRHSGCDVVVLLLVLVLQPVVRQAVPPPASSRACASRIFVARALLSVRSWRTWTSSMPSSNMPVILPASCPGSNASACSCLTTSGNRRSPRICVHFHEKGEEEE